IRTITEPDEIAARRESRSQREPSKGRRTRDGSNIYTQGGLPSLGRPDGMAFARGALLPL
ncbi:hypothetical protein GW17_00048080, partial [Ensete ventricosum]